MPSFSFGQGHLIRPIKTPLLNAVLNSLPALATQEPMATLESREPMATLESREPQATQEPQVRGRHSGEYHCVPYALHLACSIRE